MTTRLGKEMPTFSVAATQWLEEHRRYIRPNTVRSYMDGIKALTPVLGQLQINRIQISHIRKYQDIRVLKVKPHSVNRELGIFQQIMKEYDQWARLQSRYRTLRESPRRAGHSLSAEEEHSQIIDDYRACGDRFCVREIRLRLPRSTTILLPSPAGSCGHPKCDTTIWFRNQIV